LLNWSTLGFLATAIFNMWGFKGTYIFGTAPFGTPLLEETLFCILIPLGIISGYKYRLKSKGQLCFLSAHRDSS